MIAQIDMLQLQLNQALAQIAPAGAKPARVFKPAARQIEKALRVAAEAQRELRLVGLELEMAKISRELPADAANLLAALKEPVQ